LIYCQETADTAPESEKHNIANAATETKLSGSPRGFVHSLITYIMSLWSRPVPTGSQEPIQSGLLAPCVALGELPCRPPRNVRFLVEARLWLGGCERPPPMGVGTMFGQSDGCDGCLTVLCSAPYVVARDARYELGPCRGSWSRAVGSQTRPTHKAWIRGARVFCEPGFQKPGSQATRKIRAARQAPVGAGPQRR
jgi:hypothetical protein